MGADTDTDELGAASNRAGKRCRTSGSCRRHGKSVFRHIAVRLGRGGGDDRGYTGKEREEERSEHGQKNVGDSLRGVDQKGRGAFGAEHPARSAALYASNCGTSAVVSSTFIRPVG